MVLLNINNMLAGVGFSAFEANALQDQITSLGNLAVPPSQGGQSINPMGNANVQISSAGISPAATGADKVVAVYSIPASAFDAANRTATLQACGSFAANGDTKRVKIIVGATAAIVGQTVSGGTAIADTAAVTTNGGGWALSANLVKYGAAGSNTQLGLHNQAQIGAAVAALLAPQTLTLTESAAILVTVTANCTTTASDVVFNWFELTWSN